MFLFFFIFFVKFSYRRVTKLVLFKFSHGCLKLGKEQFRKEKV